MQVRAVICHERSRQLFRSFVCEFNYCGRGVALVLQKMIRVFFVFALFPTYFLCRCAKQQGTTGPEEDTGLEIFFT